MSMALRAETVSKPHNEQMKIFLPILVASGRSGQPEDFIDQLQSHPLCGLEALHLDSAVHQVIVIATSKL